MTSFVDIDEDIEIPFDAKKLLEDILSSISDSEDCPYETTVNLCITHGDEVHRINREFRNIDDTTDVLSFPVIQLNNGDFESIDEEDPAIFDPDTGELMLGDMIINYDRVISQADMYGHSIRRELGFLIAHSIYHLMGYDHMDEESARLMESKQEDTLNALGITREKDV